MKHPLVVYIPGQAVVHELMTNIVFVDKMESNFCTGFYAPFRLVKGKNGSGMSCCIFPAGTNGNLHFFGHALAATGQFIQVLSHDHCALMVHDVIMIHVMMVMHVTMFSRIGIMLIMIGCMTM